MHLLNFAHGELITVGGYVALWTLGAGWSWYIVTPLIVLSAVLTSLAIERVAFSRVRGSSDFTLLLTSFGVHFVISAIFLLYVSASVKPFDRPSWVTNTYSVGPLNIEVYDTVVIVGNRADADRHHAAAAAGPCSGCRCGRQPQISTPPG